MPRGYGPRPADDDAPGLTLDVEERPTINEGDTLLVFPDVGDAYRADVLAADPDAGKLKVRLPHDPRAPLPVGSQTRHFYRAELEEFRVRGDLIINPPDRELAAFPGPDYAGPPV